MNYLIILIFAICFPIQFALATNVERKQFTLIDGIKGNLTISIKYSLSLNKLTKESSISQAIELNNFLINKPFNSIKKLEKYIELDDGSYDKVKSEAKLTQSGMLSAKYNIAWVWGDYVLLTLDYNTQDGNIFSWREDFRCAKSAGCKLSTVLPDQLFELSYRILLGNFISSGNLDSLVSSNTKSSQNIKTITSTYVHWNEPFNKPKYIKENLENGAIQWALNLEGLDITIKKKDNIWVDHENTIAQSMVTFLNNFQKDNYSIYEDKSYQESNINLKDYQIYEYEFKKSGHKKIILLDESLLIRQIENWNRIKLIGYIKLDGRGLLYFKPYHKVSGESIDYELIPVWVFEFADHDGAIKIIPGIKKHNWDNTLLTNEHLLESLRRYKAVNQE